ncbi:uncharacterized protein LOC106178101 [Lingula anatina]|uniref:Uncharacterized protein LOC106178101 n=1 Tax=Lingula anatina TaxID=7574 RepID=A0A1S3K2H3_LINAN|nr:uncharacterized protein LOC106178101 [Lingula anatina]|eukprot:XP_013416594.1 uncharacterized protein LOC106178101 [Lingula anatina]
MLMSLYFTLAFALNALPSVFGHGRLIEPPSRSSLWRFQEFVDLVTPNYNDNELFCGGVFRQYQRNGGKCGVCGDPWDEPSPRANENGGIYDFGITSRYYKKGQVFTTEVDLTANHKGWFEFRICPNDDPSVQVTHECLDQHLLQLADGSGTRWEVNTDENKVFELRLRLPSDLLCNHCVFQWKYHTGNSWGTDDQEEFYGCADIQISENGAVPSTTTAKPTTGTTSTTASTVSTTTAAVSTTRVPTSTTAPTTTSTTSKPIPTSSVPTSTTTSATKSTTTKPIPTSSKATTTAPASSSTTTATVSSSTPAASNLICVGVPPYNTHLGVNEWCTTSCNAVPSYCPPTMCSCRSPPPPVETEKDDEASSPETGTPVDELPDKVRCVAVPPYDKDVGINEWCTTSCNAFPVYCPPTMCACSA